MKYILKPITLVILGVIVAGGILVYGSHFSSKPDVSAETTVERRDLTADVAVTGTVTAAQDVALSFQRGGQVVSLVGDVGTKISKGQAIASVSSADLESQLRAAQIALQGENIKLGNLQASASTASSSIQVGIQNASATLASQLTQTSITIDGVLASYVDPLYATPRTMPNFGVVIAQNGTTYNISAPEQTAIQLDNQRQQVTTDMAQFISLTATAKTSGSNTDLQAAYAQAQTTFQDIQTLLANLTSALSAYTPADTTSQALYNQYKAGILTARTAVNSAQSTLQTDNQAYLSANTSTGTYNVSLQQVAVSGAAAQVSALQTQIAEGTIYSPISGVITEEDVKVGEVAAENTPVIHVISNGNLQIDAYVSEADINKIKVGSTTASVSLVSNAQASSTPYIASVVAIDPAETITNGVGSYKVTLQFNAIDASIRPGMTANVDFQVGSAENVLTVPSSAIITSNNQSYVLVAGANGTVIEKPVTIGIQGNGYTEITSGLSEGDKIIPFGNQ